MMKKQRRKTYTFFDELMAKDDELMPEASRTHQITEMRRGLAAIEKDPNPTANDWRVCSDAVNLMETLIKMSDRRDKNGKIIEANRLFDHLGLLPDAVAALANAGRRGMSGGVIRLDGQGMNAVRSVLDDYEEMLSSLSHRTMIRCHRQTETRIHEILDGKRKPHDVEIVNI